MTDLSDKEINDIKEKISATFDTIIGLENSIEVMEDEIRKIRRKKNVT